jgi:hypothetical protein
MRSLRTPILALAAAAAPLFVCAVGACGGAAFSSDARDAATSAPLEASTLDAGTAPDAATGFCARDAGPHTFCEDFDEAPLATDWDTVDQAGGEATLDDTTSTSAPASFSSLTHAAGGTAARARVVKGFARSARVTMAFDLKVDEALNRIADASVGGVSLLVVNLGSSYSVGLSVNETQLSFFENIQGDGGVTVGGQNVKVTDEKNVQGWTHVTFMFHLAGSSPQATITAGPDTITAPLTPLSTAAVPMVNLGLFSRNLAGDAQAHFDNVTIDVTP